MKIRLPLSSVILDEATQCREKTDEALVADFADGYRRGDAFPAPDVFGPLDDEEALPPGAKVWIGDGHTRIRAALRADVAMLDFEVHAGGEEEAFLFALRANRRHGARVTNADKRCAVGKALARWPNLSDREIGRRAELSHEFVRQARAQLSTVDTPRTGADGRTRALPKKEAAAPPQPEAGEHAAGPAADAAAAFSGAAGFPVGQPVHDPLTRLFGGAPDDGGPPRADPGAVTIEADGPQESHAPTEHQDSPHPRRGDSGPSVALHPEQPEAARARHPDSGDRGGMAGGEQGGVRRDAGGADRDGPAAEPDRDPTSTLTPAEVQALREGGSALDLAAEQEDAAPATRKAAAKADEPYEVGERIALIRTSRALKDVPETDRPALQAALWDMARAIDPDEHWRAGHEDATQRALDCRGGSDSTRPGCGVCIACLTRALTAADTRVRELEARLAAGGDPEREQQAARDGYAQGRAEALDTVAGWLDVPASQDGDDLGDFALSLEEKIAELRAQRDTEQKRRRQLEEEQREQGEVIRARMRRMTDERDRLASMKTPRGLGTMRVWADEKLRVMDAQGEEPAPDRAIVDKVNDITLTVATLRAFADTEEEEEARPAPATKQTSPLTPAEEQGLQDEADEMLAALSTRPEPVIERDPEERPAPPAKKKRR